MFGQIRPLVIDEDGVVLAGNGLLTALQEMKRETADCYVMKNLTAKDKKKLMLADNKIFELGVNDTNTFDELLRELDGDIDIPGYDEELLKVLTANAKEADEIINSYGNFSEEKINEMKLAQPLTPQPQQTPMPEQQTWTPQQQTEQAQSVKRFVTCPKCGEKIWL